MKSKKRLRRGATALLLTAGAVAASAAPAFACSAQSVSQPFAAYGDSSNYFLVSGGDFALGGAAGWGLSPGASVVADAGSPSRYAADIPSGESLTTPAFCVSRGDPTARMFADTIKGGSDGSSSLAVTIIYNGGKSSKVVGYVPQQQGWGPTRKLAVALGQVLAQSGGEANVQYLFSVVRGADWHVDDIYIDPRMR